VGFLFVLPVSGHLSVRCLQAPFFNHVRADKLLDEAADLSASNFLVEPLIQRLA